MDTYRLEKLVGFNVERLTTNIFHQQTGNKHGSKSMQHFGAVK